MKNEDISKLKLNGWPLSDDYLLEIGRITALWAALETFLNFCIGKLAGFELNDPKPFILVNHASFPQRLDMLGALCEQLVDEFSNLKEYKTVISDLRSAQALRNKFTHNGMTLNTETGNMEIAIGSARGSLKTIVQRIDKVDIRKASMEIHQAHLNLYKLVLNQELRPMWERR